MSSIAYITDSKLLENHRLYQNKAMNFWRLSTNTNFTDFGIGGLVFFLSKDKDHLSSKREKGIVGFGRLVNLYVGTPRLMWDRFKQRNGYNTYEEFIVAISKANRDRALPEKLSSLYLENVCFFQSPIYLSELGISISKNVESYVYIKPDEAVLKILEYGKTFSDLWSSTGEQEQIINEEELAVILSLANKKIGGDIKFTGTKLNKALDDVQIYIKRNPIYQRILGSRFNMYYIYEDILTIVFYHNDEIEINDIVKNALAFKEYINEHYPHNLSLLFKTIDNNKEFSELVI